MLKIKLRKKYLNKVSLQLLIRRRWAYLRYLHLREGFLQAQDAESFLSIGCGTGLAEVALALEFPEVHFHLSDIVSEDKLESKLGMRMIKEWSIPNMSYGTHDILTEPENFYDIVASVEVLEHIENDTLAAANMKKIAKKYVFILVPFATEEMNADPNFKKRVWENHQHYRVGYNSGRLEKLFSNIMSMRGCFWHNSGHELRLQLDKLSNEEIEKSLVELEKSAKADIHNVISKNRGECFGIWLLAGV